MSKTLAVRLRAARHAMHPPITQREIAKRFRVTPGAVCLWEKGHTEPSTEVLAELAKLYKVSTDWLVGLPERQPTTLPPIHLVPVVSARALLKWRLTPAIDLLQTSVAYPEGTAAAIMVSSDALNSACPTGSYVVISRTLKPSPGAIVLAANGKVAEPILRRYTEEAGERLLLADDARWPIVRLEPRAHVLGCVAEVTIRKLLM